jgi:hypothetical protein
VQVCGTAIKKKSHSPEDEIVPRKESTHTKSVRARANERQFYCQNVPKKNNNNTKNPIIAAIRLLFVCYLANGIYQATHSELPCDSTFFFCVC